MSRGQGPRSQKVLLWCQVHVALETRWWLSLRVRLEGRASSPVSEGASPKGREHPIRQGVGFRLLAPSGAQRRARGVPEHLSRVGALTAWVSREGLMALVLLLLVFAPGEKRAGGPS